MKPAYKLESLDELVTEYKRTGAQIVVDVLNELGVEYIFGHTGGAVIPLHVEMGRRRERGEKIPRFVLCAHEAGAGHAAEGYATASGKVGVALATSGPGATNLVTPIADAYKDSHPVVFLTGQANKDALGSDSFQEVDMVGITRPITKHSYLVKETDDIGWIVRQAFYIASTGRPGPVVVDICKNALVGSSSNGNESRSLVGYNPKATLKEDDANSLLEDLLKHEKPIILAGGGIITGDSSKELYSFSKKYNIPVAITFMALGALPKEYSLYLGMSGMHGTVAANFALRDADFILALGARFDDRVAVKDFGKGKKIAHIDIDNTELNKRIYVNHALNAHVKDFLEYALGYSTKNIANRSEWLRQIDYWKRNHKLRYEEKEGIMPQYAIEQIGELTNGNAVITTGVGQHQMWAAQYYPFKYARQWISSGGLGTMGFGIPAAIGAYLGNPSKQIVCIDGDGSFKMNQQELETVAINNLPIKIFVLNNGYLGMVRQWEDAFEGGYHDETILNRKVPDLLKLSAAYGINALRIREKKEAILGITQALNTKGPYLVDVWIHAKEDVKPMIPPGGSLNDLIH